MDYGVHLPLIDFGQRPFSLEHLLKYTQTAARLGYKTIATNDHLLFSRPWLDGPTALASVIAATEGMSLATSVALPIVRGPIALAKTLAAIDLLSGGRLIAGIGAGSSPRDYAAVGIPFEERWKRLEEAVEIMRRLWHENPAPFQGRFYNTDGITLEPYPRQPGGPGLWIGSWGSDIGLRRVARLGDGWLASGYNATPEIFGDAWVRLQDHLREVGKQPDRFPNALVTLFFYVTEDRRAAERIIHEILAPALNRPEADLRQRLLIGPAEESAEKLAAYQSAGAQRVFLWPVTDELQQLERFQERVAPLVEPAVFARAYFGTSHVVERHTTADKLS